MGDNLFPKTFTALTLVLLIVCLQAFSQTVITENFDDGDFAASPSWSGMSEVYVVNENLELQLNNVVAATSYLSTDLPINEIGEAVWEFVIRHDFSGSSNNFTRVYLMSDQADLTVPLNGYFLRFGENLSNDAIELFKQTGTTITSVCRGRDATIASPFTAQVRVSRSVKGHWEIFADYSGSNDLTSEAVGIDSAHVASSYFGFRNTYTISNAKHFFLDSVSVSANEAPDAIAPQLTSIDVISNLVLQLNFSEEIDLVTGQTPANYSIAEGTINPASAELNGNEKTIRLTFSASFVNGHRENLSVSGVEDKSGNVIEPVAMEFLFFEAIEPAPNDIIITELLPDPLPSVGLPEAEFIELYNRSEHPFDLQGWKITDGSSIGTLSSYILLPGNYVILAPSSAAALFASYGDVISLSSFPSLNNAGDVIRLKDALDNLMDSVNYSSSWYKDEDKHAGGWTLERIDPDDVCSQHLNWTASIAELGGTPGKQNSLYDVSPDIDGPRFQSVRILSADTIALLFNEALSAAAIDAADIQLDPYLEIEGVTLSNDLTSLVLTFFAPLDSVETYTMTLHRIFDCSGNPIDPAHNTLSFKLDSIKPAVVALSVINETEIEILFSERLSPSTSEAIANYQISEIKTPQSAITGEDGKTVTLTFSEPFTNGAEFTLSIDNVSDRSGNSMDRHVATLLFYQSTESCLRDIIITEIFADPAPRIGLPEAEFLEIYNRSNHPQDLQGWTLSDATRTTSLSNKILLPGAYLILCSKTNKPAYDTLGETLAVVSFPTLNNTGEQLILRNPSGTVIDSIRFDIGWYHDDEKKDGGYSLERMNPEDFCKEDLNWVASEDLTGGTPGRQNSTYSNAIDTTGPKLSQVIVTEGQRLSLVFNEAMQRAMPETANFNFSPAVSIDSIFMESPFTEITILLSAPLDSAYLYTIWIHNLNDCPGNIMDPDYNSASIKLDGALPGIREIAPMSPRVVKVSFTEKVNREISLSNENYNLGNDNPEEVILEADEKSALLTFSFDFVNGEERELKIKNVPDRAGNVMRDTAVTFLYFIESQIHFKDIVFTEVFPDPSPSVGMPEGEFVELLNRGSAPINMKDWRLTDGSSTVVMKQKILMPGEYLIVTTLAQAIYFEPFGAVVASSTFPSLNNSGDMLLLKNANGFTVDSINYSNRWHADDEREEGGFSLEIIDPNNICAEETNWTSSEDAAGGTPGKVNSVNADKPDLKGPTLVEAFALNEYQVILTFSEKLDKKLPTLEHYQISPPLAVYQANHYDPSLRIQLITLASPLATSAEYQVTVSSIFDCAGNSIDSERSKATFALPDDAVRQDIVINEVLFNPRPTGNDFIEVFNRSEKYINLRGWQVASANDGRLDNFQMLTVNNKVFGPKSFLVFTKSANVLKGEYLQTIEENVFTMELPPLPDAEGTIVLIDNVGAVIDSLFYFEDMHAPLLKDEEAVSLERISSDIATHVRSNWKSASSTAGYATPGFQNSNAFLATVTDESVFIDPEVFSPLEGLPNFSRIHYRFDQGGFVANVRVIDRQGREIKTLASNELLGTEGLFRWDGDDNNGTKARIGSYMVLFEVFNIDGTVKTIRKRVVVAGRF